MDAAHHQLVVITGFSGAGKSTAVRQFEDHGWFCVDNLPPAMLSGLAELVDGDQAGRRAAVVCDARSGTQALAQLAGRLDALDASALRPFLVFITADEQTLINRYKETRRRHPLADGMSASDGIAREALLLEPLRRRADLVLDTTQLNASQLAKRLGDELLAGTVKRPTLTICSFGYKHGPPRDADLAMDVRFLPNPYYDPQLRPLTGRDPRVAEYVARDGTLEAFYGHLHPMIDFLLPRYASEGKTHLVIAVGCTGGRHRSVAIAEALGARLARHADFDVVVRHRDIDLANEQYLSSRGALTALNPRPFAQYVARGHASPTVNLMPDRRISPWAAAAAAAGAAAVGTLGVVVYHRRFRFQKPAEPEAGDLFYDRRARRWMVCVDTGAGLTLMELDERSPRRMQRAVDEAVEFICAGTPRVRSDDEELDPQTPSVRYDVDAGRWKLWVACSDCGGAEVGLSQLTAGELIDARREAGRVCRMLFDHPQLCPGCVSGAIRDGSFDVDDTVSWYDPTTGEWQITHEFDGVGKITVPLGLHSILVAEDDLNVAAERALDAP